VNANSSAAQDRVAGTELYRELVRRCRAAGVLRPTPLVDVIRSVAVMSLYASAFGALLTAPAWPARLALLAVTAFASVQAGMIGHDAGHGAFAWSPGQFGWPGHLFLTIGAGWPFAHWIAAHHGHHRHTN
jgi:fatty acid desaturase